VPSGPVASALVAAEITDFGISVRHQGRLLGGLLLATSPRVDWAKLLRRTYATDVLACAYCGGRLQLLTAILDKVTARKILEHLGVPPEPIAPRPRARDPAEGWASAPTATE
jgi:hypothetical protein